MLRSNPAPPRPAPPRPALPRPASPQLCVCMFLGLACTWFVPETKGKTLEQIWAEREGGVSACCACCVCCAQLFWRMGCVMYRARPALLLPLHPNKRNSSRCRNLGECPAHLQHVGANQRPLKWHPASCSRTRAPLRPHFLLAAATQGPPQPSALLPPTLLLQDEDSSASSSDGQVPAPKVSKIDSAMITSSMV